VDQLKRMSARGVFVRIVDAFNFSPEVVNEDLKRSSCGTRSLLR